MTELGRQDEPTPPEQPAATDGDSAKKSPEELQREVEATREELGETVDALAQKADVKTQISEVAAQRKEQVKAKQEELKQKVAGIGGGDGASAEQAKQMASQVAVKANEEPAPFIAGAFAVGLVLGLLFGRR